MDAIDIREFVPNDAPRSEWDAWHEYEEVRHQELYPDDPIWPRELNEISIKRDDPFRERRWFTIWRGEELIGRISTSTTKPANPEYETSKHLLSVGASILEPHRRQGIATELFVPKAIELAKFFQNTVISVGTIEESGHSFLRKLGASENMVGAENRLKFGEIDWQMVEGWIKEGVERSPDVSLRLFEERLPESEWDDFLPVYTQLMNQQPFDDLDHGEIIYTPEKYREGYERLTDEKGSHHVMMTRESDGAISGMTEVWWFEPQPGYVYQGLTGVIPKYRSRGLGKWLKAAMLDYLRNTYEKITWVVTGNANSNDPMLSINKRLGFTEHKGGSTYQVKVEDLEQTLASLRR